MGAPLTPLAKPPRGSTTGKILGALGLLSLLTAPYTYFVTTGSPWAAGMKAVLGAVLIGAFFVTNGGAVGELAFRRTTSFFGTSALLVTTVVIGLVAINYIAAKRAPSWDLTRKKIYTLDPRTHALLHTLAQPVRASVFIQPGTPGLDVAEALLARYRRESGERFDYLFLDPRKVPALTKKYAVRGGQLTLVLVQGDGAGERHTSVTVVSGQELSEQGVTGALRKLTQAEQTVFFISGHSEWALERDGADDTQSLSELAKSMDLEGSRAQTLNLAGKTEIPKGAAGVVIAGARTPLSNAEEAILGRYLEEGGRLLVFADSEVDGGLKSLLAAYGVEVDSGILADDQFFLKSPYILLTAFYGEHPLAKELKRLQLRLQIPTARGLTVLKQGVLEGVVTEPVVLTSPQAWEDPTLRDKPVRPSGAKMGSIPLLVSATRPILTSPSRRSEQTRLVVMGDSELLVDVNWGHESNRNLVLNAIAWTTGQTTQLDIRAPDRDASTLDLDETRLGRIRFLAMDALPLSLLAIGLAVWLRRRNQ